MAAKLFMKTVKLETTTFVWRIFLLKETRMHPIENRAMAPGREVNFQT